MQQASKGIALFLSLLFFGGGGRNQPFGEPIFCCCACVFRLLFFFWGGGGVGGGGLCLFYISGEGGGRTKPPLRLGACLEFAFLFGGGTPLWEMAVFGNPLTFFWGWLIFQTTIEPSI